MIANLREAKSRFSELVRRALGGEEIVITLRGEPAVRLTAVASAEKGPDDRHAWVEELTAAAKAASTGTVATTPQHYWDEARGGR